MAGGGTALVAEAADPIQAQIWVSALREAGIEAATFERGVGAALGGAVTSGVSRFPVVVARDDLVGARNVIAELDGAVHLAPIDDPEGQRAARRRVLVTVTTAAAVILAIAVGARLAAG